MKKPHLLLAILLPVLGLLAPFRPVQATQPVVHGVLFFSPSCGHCHKVITQDLPPLIDKYGDQLVLVGVDITSPQGNALFQAALEAFQIPNEQAGVPTLVVGEQVLVGSQDIPEQLPGLIEQGLARGGIGWPRITGLQELVESAGLEWSSLQPVAPATVSQRFRQDLIANSLAFAVLVGMFLSLVWNGYAYFKPASASSVSWPKWVIPALAVLGLLVSAYMSYVEILQTEAVCGPVGDCNTVQSSPYARLFGLIPIGLLGLAGYGTILAVWAFQSFGPPARRKAAAFSLWALALGGTLFSIYLTFLEPFVIGATCAWCLTSAVVMTLVLWASSGPALTYLKTRA